MYRLLFEKKDQAVWISHLDLMRVFQRAFRRAGYLLKHSQGFTPRAIVSLALPLSVGTESQCEMLDFELEDGSCPDIARLNHTLPAGIRILSVYDHGRKIKDLTYLKARLQLQYDLGIPHGTTHMIRQMLSQPRLIMTKHSRKGETQMDILPMLKEWQLRTVGEDLLEWDVLVHAQNPSLNPQLLASAFVCNFPEWKPDGTRCRRLEVYDREGGIFR